MARGPHCRGARPPPAARMTLHGQLLLVQRVRDAGWPVVEAAAAAGVSLSAPPIPGWRAIAAVGEPRPPRSQLGARSLALAGCRPRPSPRSSVCAASAGRGPRIARALRRPVSTVGNVLRRLGPRSARRPSTLRRPPSATSAAHCRRTAPPRHQKARPYRRRSAIASPVLGMATGHAASAGSSCTSRSSRARRPGADAQVRRARHQRLRRAAAAASGCRPRSAAPARRSSRGVTTPEPVLIESPVSPYFFDSTHWVTGRKPCR